MLLVDKFNKQSNKPKQKTTMNLKKKIEEATNEESPEFERRAEHRTQSDYDRISKQFFLGKMTMITEEK